MSSDAHRDDAVSRVPSLGAARDRRDVGAVERDDDGDDDGGGAVTEAAGTTATRASDERGGVDAARACGRVIDRACGRAWGGVPLLRAVDGTARRAAEAELEAAAARAREGTGEIGSVVMPTLGDGGGARLVSGRGRSAELLREHWEELRALDRQLANACASFSSEDECGFAYAREYEVAREWNGTVLELKAPKPTLKSAKGLSEEEYKKVVGASQWIRGVLEGATRIALLSVEAMPVPATWQSSVGMNAKEIIGARMYGELSVSPGFDAEALADREAFWGSDFVTDETSKSAIDAVAMLDNLEKAEAVWSSKLKEQQTIDSLQTVQAWGHGARVKELSRKLRNSSAYRRTLYARYPNVEFTSLQQMKITRNVDVALAALQAYAGCLIRVAASLRERALDVLDAHHAIVGGVNPHRRRPKVPSTLDYVSMGIGYTSAFVYDLRKSLEQQYDDMLALVGAHSRGCSAAPTACPADRSPAAIHYISDVSDSDSDEFTTSP